MGEHKWKNIKLISHNMNRVMHKSDKDVRRQMKIVEGDIKTILDIGACIGTFSLSYAFRLDNSDLKIYAVEPVFSSYNALVENIRLNGYQKLIKPFNFGFDIVEGDVIMGVPPSRANENNDGLYTIMSPDEELSKKVSCKVIKLSRFIKDHDITEIDIIKIDAEGKEIDILREGVDFLSHVRYIHIEVNYNFKSSKNISSFLKKAGFFYLKNTGKINEIWKNNNYVGAKNGKS